MESNGIRNARVRATGKVIQVYMHNATMNWVDAFDCQTMYKKEELEFI